MTALQSLIKQTALTPYAFGLKHQLPNIYTKSKNENFNLNTVFDLARKEKINKLTFKMFGASVSVEL